MRQAYHSLGRGADEETRDRRPWVSSDDDEIGSDLLRHVVDGRRRQALTEVKGRVGDVRLRGLGRYPALQILGYRLMKRRRFDSQRQHHRLRHAHHGQLRSKPLRARGPGD